MSHVEFKAYIPPQRKPPCLGASRWAIPPAQDFCVANTNMLISKKLGGPNTKPEGPNTKPGEPNGNL